MDSDKIKYTCIKGLILELGKLPDHEYEDKYENFCVYHDISVPEGLFPECITCKLPELGISINENDNKGHLVKLCEIWKIEE
jgi:hypothetical protein